MKKLVLFSLILGCSQNLLAQDTEANADDDSIGQTGLYLDWGGRSEPSALVGEIGVIAYPSRSLSLRASLSFLAYEKNNDTLVGVNAGARYNFGKMFTPFVGLGTFFGCGSENMPAEDDNIDNDNDGSVDEDGEVETKITDAMASIYPEVGFHVWATDAIRVTLATKYHVTTHGRKSDFQMYNVGFAFWFD